MKNIDHFITSVIKNSEQFIANVEVWEDYPKDQSYFAIAKLLKECEVHLQEKLAVLDRINYETQI